MFGLFGKNSDEIKSLRSQIETLKSDNAALSEELYRYKTFYERVMESAKPLSKTDEEQPKETIVIPVVAKGEDATFEQDHRKLKDAII